jgi:hypothetical protein
MDPNAINPEFARMSIKELRTYVLNHRDDEVTFHALVDRLAVNSTGEVYPYPTHQKRSRLCQKPSKADLMLKAIR